ncbi:hypothetical protein BJ322DRAFT_1106942 [Thelephora terrestris]|uniref:Uncharacterized protein n=1 Tax=Thelephora terrestris TaxID=56493 RepID=A0A9P6L865_9AGAM|nr:hypothetical protein BJ322DRAFT_1106942 [Thelephora terrestris]
MVSQETWYTHNKYRVRKCCTVRSTCPATGARAPENLLSVAAENVSVQQDVGPPGGVSHSARSDSDNGEMQEDDQGRQTPPQVSTPFSPRPLPSPPRSQLSSHRSSLSSHRSSPSSRSSQPSSRRSSPSSHRSSPSSHHSQPSSQPSPPRPPSPPADPPLPPPPPGFDEDNPGRAATPLGDDYPPAVIPKIRTAIEFIHMVEEATLESQFDPEQLEELLDPQEHEALPPDDPIL